jgi:hypothetical protein
MANLFAMTKKQDPNLKFFTNDNNLSDGQIDKHKDFTKLMHEYQKATTPLYKTPLYKNKKVFLVVLLIILAIVLIIESMEEKEKTSPPPSKETPTIKP